MHPVMVGSNTEFVRSNFLPSQSTKFLSFKVHHRHGKSSTNSLKGTKMHISYQASVRSRQGNYVEFLSDLNNLNA